MPRAFRRYQWSSIEGGRLPIVWLHPETGDGQAVKLVFSSLAEMAELVNTLRGEIHARKRRAALNS